MIKSHSLGCFLYFINILRLIRFPIHPQTQANSNLGVGSIFSMCPPFPSLPSSTNLSRSPLSFQNSHEISLGWYIQTLHVMYVIFHPSYMIFFIAFIASSSLLSQSQGIQSKCISLLTHPRTFRLSMDSKLRENALWHKNSSLCGPHSLHAPLPVQFSLVFI